jgi:Type ISP C-terminal specificity domain
VCSDLPDLDCFSGRGAKDIIPFYTDANATATNLAPGLLETLGADFGHQVRPQDFLAYTYGILAHPAFTQIYAAELETRQLRVPITRDYMLFQRVRDAGARLLWLHTFGRRFAPEAYLPGHMPQGAARCVAPVPDDEAGYPQRFWYNDGTRTIHVGDGRFAPVEPHLWSFEVSGLNVVPSWLRYRMRTGAGRKSSMLDERRPTRWTREFTTELLELLWVLEFTHAEYVLR